jgi:hypothetical protein
MQGSLYFEPKTTLYLFPPPSENEIFPPLATRGFFFYFYPGLYALILPYFQIYFILLLPLFFSFPFLPFLLHFHPFHFSFFPKMTLADISPPWAGIFSNI